MQLIFKEFLPPFCQTQRTKTYFLLDDYEFDQILFEFEFSPQS